jgi:hypothetical protein
MADTARVASGFELFGAFSYRAQADGADWCEAEVGDIAA